MKRTLKNHTSRTKKLTVPCDNGSMWFPMPRKICLTVRIYMIISSAMFNNRRILLRPNQGMKNLIKSWKCTIFQ